ncbi:MAG TPA: YihY/virulence factor BrkB family protein [Thermoanaerobaculia bacterium]|nr:YihY/virulence factor BrkB family protein [Thermoanaerobaculia bacterium]
MRLHRPKPQKLWPVLRDTFANWNKHGATTHSAAIAFLSISSFAPILVLAVAVAGWVFGEEAAHGEIQRYLTRFIGPEGAAVVQDVVAASARKDAGRLAAILGVVTLLTGATAVLAQLQDTLNTVWEVCPKPGFFLKVMFKKRLLCFLLVLGVGALVLLSLAASAAITYVQGILEARLEVGLATLVGWADVLLSGLLMTLLFGMIYRILPDVRLEWRDVVWGSVFTAGLFLLGKYAIGLYLRTAAVASSFGAAGSLVVVLLWIYYSSLIFLLGAEFTRVHSRRYRLGRAEPEPGAVHTVTVTKTVETPASAETPTPVEATSR